MRSVKRKQQKEIWFLQQQVHDLKKQMTIIWKNDTKAFKEKRGLQQEINELNRTIARLLKE